MQIFIGVPWREGTNESRVVRTGHFSNFGELMCYVFGTFRVEANIITLRHKVPYRLSSYPKMLDLID